MLIFARIWREKPDFFQNRYFLQLFLLKYVKPIDTHIKTPFNTSEPLFSGKKGQKWVKNSQKDPQITIEIAL